MATPVLFFGASFNPPTLAHRAIVEALLKDCPDSHVLLVPVFQHIYADKSALIAYEHRLNMTRLAFADLVAQGLVTVSTLEKETHDQAHDPSHLGTVDVLHYIKQFTDLGPVSLVLGYDTYQDFFGGKWKDADEIMTLVDKIHGFDRNGFTLIKPTRFADKVCLHHGAISSPAIQNLSSTQLRNDPVAAKQGVHSDVYDYMRKYHCYG